MELGTYLPYLVNRLGQRFVAEFSPALAAEGVDVQMWRVLSALYQRGEQPITVLSGLTSINLSTLSRLVGRMDAKGLVARQRGGDARRVIVGLRPAGREVTERLIPAARALEDRAAEAFSEAELATLRQLLSKLYAGFSPEAGNEPGRLAG